MVVRTWYVSDRSGYVICGQKFAVRPTSPAMKIAPYIISRQCRRELTGSP